MSSIVSNSNIRHQGEAKRGNRKEGIFALQHWLFGLKHGTLTDRNGVVFVCLDIASGLP